MALIVHVVCFYVVLLTVTNDFVKAVLNENKCSFYNLGGYVDWNTVTNLPYCSFSQLRVIVYHQILG